MPSNFGSYLNISIFGESHGKAIGVVIGNLPPGEKIDEEELSVFLQRRAGGNNAYSTKRKEPDVVKILSGLYRGRTSDSPLCAVIENLDTREGDYASLAQTPRPGHADFPAFVKSDGYADPRGGGHFSGRLTAPLCIAGGILLQMLRRRGITIGAHISAIGSIEDSSFHSVSVTPEELLQVSQKEFPTIDDALGEDMKKLILQAAEKNDSVGGKVECFVLGLPAGLGLPVFEGLENKIASCVFAIPAVKGIDFGAGFEATAMLASEHNDAYLLSGGGSIRTKTNHHGGILGGLSTGMPLYFKAAFKPTPSIAQEQKTIDLQSMRETTISIHGRHDPCVVLRAVPAIESAAAIAVMDLLLLQKHLLLKKQ